LDIKRRVIDGDEDPFAVAAEYDLDGAAVFDASPTTTTTPKRCANARPTLRSGVERSSGNRNGFARN
ncbi:MAG: hypothetical protein ABEH60_03445, partial [Halonotius sp.]